MNALTVRGKLTFAFACVLLIMTLLGGFAVLQLARVNGQTETILAYRLTGVRDSLRMYGAAVFYRQREFRLLVTEAKDTAGALAKLDKSRSDFEAARKDYADSVADAAERGLYEQAMAGWKDYLDVSTRAIAAAAAGRHDEARDLVANAAGSKRFDETLAGIKKLAEYNDSQAGQDAARARSIYEGGRLGVVVTVLGAVFTAVGLGWLISRAISVPLGEAVVLAESVASGDLTHAPTAHGRDEVAQLTRALADMVARLRAVVVEVRSGVESVSTASAQIATGNLDLSQRTEEQASNLQQTAASMEELTSTVKQNADNARAASQLAAGATDVAARGGQVVGDVVATMQAITESSRRISDIIGVIDGIAFQTNILALNAAVEAARAGEQGRGFAVVAAEVRSLAQRSAEAAKEIKALIQQSVGRVDDGARLVAEAGQTMSDIVQQVKRVHDLVGEISSASVEQSQGISQVGDAVAQLDQVTQQNAALVEESAAAADSMKQQAKKLADTVSIFNVGGVVASAPAAAPRARSAEPTSVKRVGVARESTTTPEWASF